MSRLRMANSLPRLDLRSEFFPALTQWEVAASSTFTTIKDHTRVDAEDGEDMMR